VRHTGFPRQSLLTFVDAFLKPGPLLVLLAIVYVRLDFSITVDAGAEAKMKVN